MSLDECLEKLSHRQYLTWLQWQADQWNNPQLSDYYLMQIALEVRRVLMKEPDKVQLHNMQLKFVDKDELPEDTRTPEQRIAESKAAWFGAVGYKGQK